MSTTLVPITNANTFGQWKDRTNDIIDVLAEAVTIGDDEINAGNIVIGNNGIGGNISGNTLFINTIDAPADNTANLITINADAKLTGELQINSAAAANADNLIAINADAKLTGELQINSATAAEVKYYLSDALTWTLGTNATQTQFDIKKGNALLRIDGDAGTITGTNLTIADGLLPTSILSTGGGTLTGNLKINDTSELQLGTDGTAKTTLKQGDFGVVGLNVPDSFIITTSGVPGESTSANVFWSFIPDPGAETQPTGSSLYIANGLESKIQLNSYSGDIVAEGTVTSNGSVSDINRKENLVKIEGALDKISQVSGYTYNYIGDPTPMTGVIAQEFEEVLPQVVYEVELLDGEVSKAVMYGNIVGLLIEAIKELKAEIEELKVNGR